MVPAAPVTEDHDLAAVEVGAEAAVAAPAAVAAIPVAVAEDHHATRLVTAALVPVPKSLYHQCFFPFGVYPPVLPLSFPDVSY